eukprot:TRINITY_DN9953_c0_g1_i1.p1 TRINITY_DN9953_c0_g1~~TRINITY_DN9953_c0_g1_i1.p1  ORF type:complete len:1890 (+),score=606.29 TRINITY_DN9953_c0_g1_i1:147-5672(+)
MPPPPSGGRGAAAAPALAALLLAFCLGGVTPAGASAPCPAFEAKQAAMFRYHNDLFGTYEPFRDNGSYPNARHLLWITFDGGVATATAGAGDAVTPTVVYHPMEHTEDVSKLHFMTAMWVQNQDGHVIAFQEFTTGAPNAFMTFPVPEGTTAVRGYSMCNVHGLHRGNAFPLPQGATPKGPPLCEISTCESGDATDTTASGACTTFSGVRAQGRKKHAAKHGSTTPFTSATAPQALTAYVPQVAVERGGGVVRVSAPTNFVASPGEVDYVESVYIELGDSGTIVAADLVTPAAEGEAFEFSFPLPGTGPEGGWQAASGSLTATISSNVHGLFQSTPLTLSDAAPQAACKLQGCDGIMRTDTFSPSKPCPVVVLRNEAIRMHLQATGLTEPIAETPSNRKHIPYIVLDGTTARVTVGLGTVSPGNDNLIHPMSNASGTHYIAMLYVEDQGGRVVSGGAYAASSPLAVLEFDIPSGVTSLRAFSLCNKHGLFVSSVQSVTATSGVAPPCGLETCLVHPAVQLSSGGCAAYAAVEWEALHFQKAVYSDEGPHVYSEKSTAFQRMHTPFLTVLPGGGAVLDVGVTTLQNGSDVRPWHPAEFLEDASQIHFTRLMYVKDQAGVVVAALQAAVPGALDRMQFTIPEGVTQLTAYAYCQRHGLYQGPTVSLPSRVCALSSCGNASAVTEIVLPSPAPVAASCLPSGLSEQADGGANFQCTQVVQGGVSIHWTLDTASQSIAIGVSSASPGWLGMSFPQTFGLMAPALAIVASGTSLATYRITSASAGGVGRDPTVGTEMSLSGASQESANGGRVLRFRRSTSGLSVQAAVVNVAWHGSNAVLQPQHTTAVSLRINFMTGGVEAIEAKDLYSHRVAHAWLMVLAWCWVIPAGVLAKRYGKPIFGLGNSIRRGTIGAAFKIHLGLMLLATAMGTASYALAVREFRSNSEEDRGQHNIIGHAVFALLAALPLMGALGPLFFPTADSPGRYIFSLVHPWVGRVAYVSAVVQCFTGVRKFESGGMLDEAEALKIAAATGVACTLCSVVILETIKANFFVRRKRRTAKQFNTDKIPWEEINTHSGTADPWVVVENRIYAIQSWAAEHPGGTSVLYEQAGGDATEAFLSFTHSRAARDRMEKYYIGEVEDDRMVSAIGLAEEIANSLVRLSLDEADRLISECDSEVPPSLLSAYKSLLLNLDAYIPFLPASLVEVKTEETAFSQKRAQDRVAREIEGNPPDTAAIAFTDIQSSTALWEAAPQAMKIGLDKHNQVIREVISETHGYEVKTIGDAFMVAFTSGKDALRFGVRIQEELVGAKWPAPLMDVSHCAEQIDPATGARVWGGPRVRVGIHMGEVEPQRNPITGRIDFFGNTVNKSARVEGASIGGAVAVTEELLQAVGEEDLKEFGSLVQLPIGKVPLKGVKQLSQLTLVMPESLAGRKKDVLAALMEKREPKPSPKVALSAGTGTTKGMMMSGYSFRIERSHHPLNFASATCATVRVNYGYLSNVQIAPRAVASVLTPVLETIQRTEGLMQTICGSLLLATWNVNRKCDSHAIQAVRFSAILRDLGWNALAPHEVWGGQVSLGLATGNCLHGGVGSHTQRVMVVLGGVVSLSQRLTFVAEKAKSFALCAGMPGARGFVDEQSLRLNLRPIDMMRSSTSADDVVVHEINTASLATVLMSWGFSCEGAADKTWSPEFSSLAVAALGGNASAAQELEDLVREQATTRTCTDCSTNVSTVMCSDCSKARCTACSLKRCSGHSVEQGIRGNADALTYLLQRVHDTAVEKRGAKRHDMELQLGDVPSDNWLGHGQNTVPDVSNSVGIKSPLSFASPASPSVMSPISFPRVPEQAVPL